MSLTYHDIPIDECGEALLPIPAQGFACVTPHPYAVLGASYATGSPWRLRQGVLAALRQAQAELERRQPGWRLQLFDAWRPLAVQEFMVWREFQTQARLAGVTLVDCTNLADLQARRSETYAQLASRVFEFWSLPDTDPQRPPPHSTGAAVDLTLLDAAGQAVAMGSPIDEVNIRSYPAHYAQGQTEEERAFHAHRELLCAVMVSAGFSRHANEWWHFSLGDQMWAAAQGQPVARYGRID